MSKCARKVSVWSIALLTSTTTKN